MKRKQTIKTTRIIKTANSINFYKEELTRLLMLELPIVGITLRKKQ